MDHAHHRHHGDMTMTQSTTPSHHTMDQHHHHHHQHHTKPEASVGPMPMGSMSMGSMSMGSMPMWFHLHTTGHFLLEGLRINSMQGIAITILLTTLVAMVYEGCNSFVVTHRSVKRTRLSRQKRLLHHVLLTLLKTFSIGLGYIIMLAVMTYNVWILIAVILGSGISHQIIRPIIYNHLKKHEEVHDFLPDEHGKLLEGNGKVLDETKVFEGNGKVLDETKEDTKLMGDYLNG